MHIRGQAETLTFTLRDDADGSFVTSGSPSAVISKDGGAPAAATNTPTYVSNNIWELDLTAAEKTAETLLVLITETGSKPVEFWIVTTPDLQPIADAHEGVEYVRWTSDATTSGTALRAAIEGAPAGTVIRPSRGDYDIGATSLTFPTLVSLVGDDREGVIIRGSLASGPTFIPGLLTTIEGVTLRNTSTGDVLGKASGSLSNGALRNSRILGGTTGVKFNSSSACLFTLENVIIRPDTEGIAISGAAHEIRIKDVSVLLQSESATVGADFQDTCDIRGDHFYINMPSALTGIGMRVGDTAQVNLHNANIHALGASINIEDETAFPTLIRGEFNRSLVTGEIANLEDLSSPLRPTVHGRELAVTAGGRTGINWGDVENPTTAQTLSQTVIKDATDVDGAVTIPVNQVVVPTSRTWTLVETDDGLKDETEKTLRDGDTRVFAIDFKNALPTNGRLEDVNAVSIASGTSGGVTFANTATDPGVDKTQAKVSITGVTAGTYEILVTVAIPDQFGGGTESGIVTLIVTD